MSESAGVDGVGACAACRLSGGECACRARGELFGVDRGEPCV